MPESESPIGSHHNEKAAQSAALMLLGTITFLMGLLFLVNHPKPGVRMFSWQVISMTVAIFSAVLIFESVNGVVKAVFSNVTERKKNLREGNNEGSVGGGSNSGRIEGSEGGVISGLFGGHFNEEETLVFFSHQAIWLGLLVLLLRFCADKHYSTKKKVNQHDQEDEEEEEEHEDNDMIEDDHGETKKTKTTTKTTKKLNEDAKKRMELNMLFWASLLAHISGFAVAHTFGELQEEFDRQSGLKWLCWLLIPITGIYVFIAFSFLRFLGEKVISCVICNCRAKGSSTSMSKSEKHLRSEMFVDNLCECRNDVATNAMGFLFSQMIRASVTNNMPDAEALQWTTEKVTVQIEGGSKEVKKSIRFCPNFEQVLILFGISALCGIVLFVCTKFTTGRSVEEILKSSKKNEGEGSEEENEEEEDQESDDNHNKSRRWCPIKIEITSVEMVEFLIQWIGMTFAWLFVASFLDMMHLVKLDSAQDPVLTRVCAALLVSFSAFLLIRILAFALDCATGRRFKNNPELEINRLLIIDANKKALSQLVSSMGMLIGLGWEKAFHLSIETVSEQMDESIDFLPKHSCFLIVSMGVVVIVASAWRFFILPTELEIKEETMKVHENRVMLQVSKAHKQMSSLNLSSTTVNFNQIQNDIDTTNHNDNNDDNDDEPEPLLGSGSSVHNKNYGSSMGGRTVV